MSNVKCHEILVLGPQAETPGVTHFGAYHRPPDGHFLIIWLIQMELKDPERYYIINLIAQPDDQRSLV